MTQTTQKKASSVDDLRSVLEELEEESEEQEAEEEEVFPVSEQYVPPEGVHNKARGSGGWSATSDAEYYTKYAGDKDVEDLEDEYAKAVLGYFRSRRRLALLSKKLQEAYDEAGMSIELAEVVVGRA